MARSGVSARIVEADKIRSIAIRLADAVVAGNGNAAATIADAKAVLAYANGGCSVDRLADFVRSMPSGCSQCRVEASTKWTNYLVGALSLVKENLVYDGVKIIEDSTLPDDSLRVVYVK